ncbi:MAG: heat-inducible transcriptional repressor HrcA [Candidatus Kapabacteria bacterium]|nr:heat-inducible transcriptional repressor HrcA [Candidatus Kapabacteria bacterium]
MKNTPLSRHTERTLSTRERSILQAIVQNFILDATPVGSRNLSKVLQEELHLSPATLRNAMADLEEMGYITQPHTSSGRVPTDKGYRYYVDSLMNIEALATKEIQTIQQNILVAKQQEAALKDVSKVLGSLSRYVSVIKMPQIAHATIDKIELFRLASRRLLVVLTLNSEIVRTLTLEASFELESLDCEDVARALNERIAGQPLDEIRTNLPNLVREVDTDNHALVRLFVDSADALLTDHVVPGGTVHIAGAQHLFDHPEFGSPSRVRSIIELIESEEIIVHLLENSAAQEGTVSIAIGSEIDSTLMEEYSLLTTKYRYAPANAVGTIGLIGPKRMNYSRLIAIMHYVASALSQDEL